MKICFIADGNSDHTLAIANYFAKHNDEVHLISYDFTDAYDQNIVLHRLRNKLLFLGNISYYISFFSWIFRIRKLIREIKPDIISIQYITTYGLLASMVRFHPLVVTAWGSDVFIQPRINPFWRYVIRSILKRSDLFICLFNVDLLPTNIVNLVPSGLTTESIPHGIDTYLFRRNNNGKMLRGKYGIEETDLVVINIRGLNPIFDPVTFIRAMPIVLDVFPNVKFLAPYEPRFRKSYEDLIRSLHIENKFIILNWMSNEEVATHLSISDVYVSTSLSDGASNALFEAMACELAPVVTDIPANRFWIKNGENGCLFEPRNYFALAKNILSLLLDKEIRELYGMRCRKIVQEYADYKTQMLKTQKLYQSLFIKYSNTKEQ